MCPECGGLLDVRTTDVGTDDGDYIDIFWCTNSACNYESWDGQERMDNE